MEWQQIEDLAQFSLIFFMTQCDLIILVPFVIFVRKCLYINHFVKSLSKFIEIWNVDQSLLVFHQPPPRVNPTKNLFAEIVLQKKIVKIATNQHEKPPRINPNKFFPKKLLAKIATTYLNFNPTIFWGGVINLPQG